MARAKFEGSQAAVKFELAQSQKCAVASEPSKPSRENLPNLTQMH
ncbi:hypothetical protein CAMRE0001_0088 [Campylobacter rectus RM3267]|uniref:Uncharacterized protein n=1 Tax=Campylobacter rectus RM3267 TaxID=553218 RepID=B9CXR7_CAMRE|nr:hypothetical protein CAMRE0001_0088 [Campylobacter rectus RM3267]